MKVVLLEFPGEVEAFLSHCRERSLKPEDFHIVALWPNVQVVLRRNNVPYSDTRPYFDNDSHRRIILTSEKWLNEIEQSLDLTDATGIKETYNSIFAFHARFYINYFLWLREILEGITRRMQVDTFVVSDAPLPAKGSGPSLGPGDRYLPTITRTFAAERSISVAVVYDRRRSGGANIADGHRTPLQFVNYVLQRLALGCVGSGAILVNALHYNMDRLIGELRQSFPRAKFVWLNTATDPVSADVYRLFKHEPADYFVSAWAGRSASVKGLDQLKASLHEKWPPAFIQIFARKIEQDLFAHIRSLAKKAQTIRYILEKIRPSLVLAPFAADGDAILGESARLLGIPSVSISHGTHTPSSSEADMVEKYRLGTGLILASYGHTAVQSPWAEKYLLQLNGKRRPEPLRTGNLILTKLDSGKRARTKQPGQKVIVYATTLKPRSSLRFQIHETLDEHLEGIADLARAVQEVGNTTLIVKLHPAAALKKDEVRELIPETRSDRVRIECRVPFEKVLATADLLVSYSSTCIEEAIQNNIPVLLYDPWARYQHLPALCWGAEAPRSAPAYYLNNSSNLTEALRWILNHHNPDDIPPEVWREHIYPAETRNEFLRFVEKSLAS